MNNQPHIDLHDKLIDHALREAIGDESPPDLTERILMAADEPQTLAYDPDTIVPSPRKRRAWYAFAAAASLLIATGWIVSIDTEQIHLVNSQKEINADSSGVVLRAKLHPDASLEKNEGQEATPQKNFSLLAQRRSSARKVFDEYQEQKQTKLEPQAVQLERLTGGPNQEKQQRKAQVESVGQVPKRDMGLQGLINDAYAALPQERADLAAAPTNINRDKAKQYSVEPGTLPARDNPSILYPNPDFWEDLTSRRKKYAQVEGIRKMQDEVFELETYLRQRGAVGRNSQAPELVRIRNEITKKKQQLLKFYESSSPENSNDRYTRIYENPFIKAKGQDALSTFSIDVDTASYANVRQFLNSGRLPPPDAVRLEELLNYFDYDYTPPTDDTPFAAHVEVAGCPWEPKHRLARIAIKGREVEQEKRPQSNLVFLIDVSGSMNQPNKLPLLVSGMKLLTRQLGENDRVAIVVYASSEGLALPSTRGDQQKTILAALEKLRAGGSTAGGAGIQLAYQVAQENFIKGGINRVILATDGDFNVGTTNTADLERLAESKAKDTGVFLTVLGFGRGNLNDAMMEAISGKGNGNYHYVDNEREARKVLVEEMSGTLVTIAKDVKIQVEFNPAKVAGYRLLGYENRMLEAKDFNDDKKDAGEIGAGHTVTALYEIVPAGAEMDEPTPKVDDLKYQKRKNEPKNQAEKLGQKSANLVESDDLLTLKLRYKQPDGDKSTKLEFPIADGGGSFSAATDDFKFASAVASFGMLLRNSEQRGDTSFAAVLEIAESALGKDKQGYRAEFLELVQLAKELVGE